LTDHTFSRCAPQTLTSCTTDIAPGCLLTTTWISSRVCVMSKLVPNLGRDDEMSSQSEIAYRALRELVATGQVQPGSLLSEQLLADQVKVGRSPMRQAISRLVHEGLLVRLARRGVMVKALSVDEIRDLYEVRECLEVLAVRAAVAHMD